MPNIIAVFTLHLALNVHLTPLVMCIMQQEDQIRLMSTTITQDLFLPFLWAPHEYEIVSTAVLIEQPFQRSE